MKISVIIPVFNEEKYIGACLTSLANQVVSPDEIIVVDNNCSDKTVLIAKKYEVEVISEKRQGMIYARNAGFSRAKGQIIARCDADTIVPENWIATIKKNFDQNEIAGLSGMVIYHDDWVAEKSSFLVRFFVKSMRFFLKHNILTGPNMAITKKVWNKVKNEICLDEKKVHEDIDLAIHVAKYGEIKFDPQLQVYSSARRIKYNPLSFFLEYPLRLVSTLSSHKGRV